MLNVHDRRDLATLGLWVLVYGLAVAPVLHAVVGHGGGARHAHVHVTEERAHAHGEDRRAHAHRDSDAAGREHSHGSQRDSDAAGREHSHGSQRDSDAPGSGKQGHGPDGHQHLTGSVEHLHALAAAWAVVAVPRVRVVSWAAEVLRGPSRAPGSAPRLTAMPQGP